MAPTAWHVVNRAIVLTAPAVWQEDEPVHFLAGACLKIVVTGGSGQLGLQVIRELQEEAGHDVLNLDRKPHPLGHRPSWVTDLSEPGGIYEACAGGIAGIVHLAAYVAPGMTGDCETFNTNVTLTYNVLKAASDLRVPRVVLVSSTAAYGFIYGRPDMTPRYLPVDEQHPSRPTDPYGLSKVVGETIADSIAASGQTSIVTLRLPGISYAPDFALLKSRMHDPEKRRTGFWAYIDSRDAARACRLALEAKLTGHRVYNVAAPRSSMREPTVELIRRFYPTVDDLRPGADPRWSGIDSSRAQKELGFEARFCWEDSGA